MWGQTLAFTIIGGLFVSVAGQIPANQDSGVARFQAQTAQLIPWRQPRCCGTNALYALLRYEGFSVTVQQVLRAAPPTAKGVSLDRLREAAGRLGRPMRVVRKTPADLIQVQTPAIAHLSSTRDGHYVVLLRADGDSVVVCDAVECSINRVPLSKFSRDWSGYLLVAESPWTRRLPWLAVLAGVALALVPALGSRIRQVAPWRGLSASTAP